MAPEVFMGERPLGAAVDIYAFGILMHQVRVPEIIVISFFCICSWLFVLMCFQ